MSHTSQPVFDQAHILMSRGEAFVIVTLLASAGHAPQDPGAKILVSSQGLQAGTVGGGKVEAKSIALALDILSHDSRERAKPLVLHWDLQKDVGMSCGGSVSMLLETFQVWPWSIVVFGAGHVAQALVRVLIQLDCRVNCLDPRPEWLEKLPQSPQLVVQHEGDLSRYAADLPPRTYCVVMTKGHDSDLPILRQLLPRKDLPFIGVIGSKVKARILRADLMREGFSKEQVQTLHCPIGLPIGTNHPGEIAISIAAQLLAIRDEIHPSKRRQSAEDSQKLWL